MILLYLNLLLIILFFYSSNQIIEKYNCKKPKFIPNFWNKFYLKKKNNCYSYAMQNVNTNKKIKKPQPGYKCNMKYIKKKDYKSNDICDKFNNRIMCDFNNQIFKINKNNKCPCNYYKVALFIDKNNKDYHFYREDENNFWSHKLGRSIVRNYDSSNYIITDPFVANKKYKKYNYNKLCGLYCKKTKFENI